MSTVHRIAVGTEIRGLRLHSVRPRPGAPGAARVEWLLALGQREKQREADAAAVRGVARSIQQALAGLGPTVGKRLDEVAGLAVELGLAVAREIVGQALDRGFVDPTPTVARCLRDCVHGGTTTDLVVRLHPDDLALVQQNLAAAPELQEEVGKARFVGDRTVARGAVRAETEAGRLRYDPREALERVAAEVRREASP